MSEGAKTYNELYQMAVSRVSSRFEAGQIFQHATQIRLHHLPRVGANRATQEQENVLRDMCERRCEGAPLQYLLGEWEFYGLPFAVGRGVLVPRPETELLVDVALELMQGLPDPEVLDVCSGSGCVAIAVSHRLPTAAVTAVELAGPAFGYLLKNIHLNHSTVRAVQADLAEYTHAKSLDLLLSNPPYIPTKAIAALQPEVHFEPRTALDGGADGLDFYRSIARLYAPQIKPGGWVCLEVGFDQSEQVKEILTRSGFGEVRIKEDLAKIPRVVCARR